MKITAELRRSIMLEWPNRLEWQNREAILGATLREASRQTCFENAQNLEACYGRKVLVRSRRILEDALREARSPEEYLEAVENFAIP